jgi:hypothetical protein
MGCKLFVALQLEVLHHFIERVSVGAPEDSNRQEQAEQAKPRKRSSRAWLTVNRKTLPPQVLRKNAASHLPMESDPRDFL